MTEEFEEGDVFNPEPDYTESVEVQEHRAAQAYEAELRARREEAEKPEHRRQEDAMAQSFSPQPLPPPGKQPLLTLGNLEDKKPMLKWIGIGVVLVFAGIGFKAMFLDK